jgi:hypothetical protein
LVCVLKGEGNDQKTPSIWKRWLSPEQLNRNETRHAGVWQNRNQNMPGTSAELQSSLFDCHCVLAVDWFGWSDVVRWQASSFSRIAAGSALTRLKLEHHERDVSLKRTGS